MKIRTTALSVAIGLAVGSVTFASTAIADESQEQAQELQKLKVTGSRIATTSLEGPSPVDIYTSEDIAEMGATSVDDVLRGLPQNGSGSYGNSYTNSFAAGTSGVSLRGLGPSRTLVLLNGRRVANYAFGQNLTDTFVDLNSIPLSAVERIDVLKDGASALYGSDAIAGVINVILKKDYEGLELKTKTGITSEKDGEELSATITGGKNVTDDTNIMFSVNLVSKGSIAREDRKNTASADLSSRGGFDWRSSMGVPGTVYDIDGNELDDLCSGFTKDCKYDYASEVIMVPESDRISVITAVNHDLSIDTSTFFEAAYNRVQTTTVSAPTPVSHRGDDAITVSSSNSNNTYGEDVKISHRITAAPNRVNETTTDSWRFVTGAEGYTSLFNREASWNTDVGYHITETETIGSGSINQTVFQQLIDNGTYNPFTDKNSAASVAPAVMSTKREGKSEIGFFNADMSLPVYALDSGDIQAALGVELRYESAEDNPDPNASQVIGSGSTSYEGDRIVSAAYTEFMIPVHEDIEVQLAGRFEHYDDFGNAFSPKVSVRYQPSDIVVFRGSYSEGFKAPTLPEIHSSSTSLQFVKDGNKGFEQREVIFSGNQNLDAEKSESFNFGVVVEPLDNLSLGADFYRITNTDKIGSLSSQDLVDNGSDLVERDAAGNIVRINNGYLNLSKQQVQGVDGNIDYMFDTQEVGSFGMGIQGSYIDSFKVSDTDGVLSETAGKDTGGLQGGGPRFKGNATLAWTQGDIKLVNVLNYTHSFDALEKRKTDSFKEIDSFTTWDSQFKYSGVENFDIAVGVNNVTNELAPFYNSSDGYNFAVHSNVGRFMYMDLTYNF
ncbi:TonB-dependent receptor [Salinivibrio costicola]|uniref:TonB-dependent receptor n=1 Tax=Salinivibrio costicola TaxID=51367 RepID=UPI003F71056B